MLQSCCCNHGAIIFATWYLHYLFFQLELNWIRIGFQVAVVEKISHTFLRWSNPMK
jgi:hypothetical protein